MTTADNKGRIEWNDSTDLPIMPSEFFLHNHTLLIAYSDNIITWCCQKPLVIESYEYLNILLGIRFLYDFSLKTWNLKLFFFFRNNNIWQVSTELWILRSTVLIYHNVKHCRHASTDKGFTFFDYTCWAVWTFTWRNCSFFFCLFEQNFRL